MSINSFGFEVMSLDDVIHALTEIKAQYPHHGQLPVWIANCPPLYWPVKNITVETNGARSELKLYVERGGN